MPRFTLAIPMAKQLHQSIMKAHCEHSRKYPGWVFAVYCRGGQRFEYSEDQIIKFHESRKP